MIFENSKNYRLQKYLQEEAKSIEKYEFTNHKMVKTPTFNGSCNILLANLNSTIAQAVEDLEENYIIFSPNQKIYFSELDEVVYSNLSVVFNKPIYWDDEKLLLINPIIVVEVLSKSTQKYDRTGKFDKYKTLESIREYVLIRQDEYYAEVWYQKEPGLWQETIIKDVSDNLTLQSVGIIISMQNIYENFNL